MSRALSLALEDSIRTPAVFLGSAWNLLREEHIVKLACQAPEAFSLCSLYSAPLNGPRAKKYTYFNCEQCFFNHKGFCDSQHVALIRKGFLVHLYVHWVYHRHKWSRASSVFSFYMNSLNSESKRNVISKNSKARDCNICPHEAPYHSEET